ncbi:hypothetical protein FEM48_Zijuj01G0115000 [Ziziphus jujuba var. spinosa]|uniref:Alpha 1,4-glycosyltransferase domain-containing protein n=1 Tax=Ziziphus jujuba var. spinosa TaxID=714518 RepID=A0A978W108_ZIZJJ|nr:hypothetical protein FEM48_Zijuj01G0115000 [Ziziphus jujuba var. spinosa]
MLRSSRRRPRYGAYACALLSALLLLLSVSLLYSRLSYSHPHRYLHHGRRRNPTSGYDIVSLTTNPLISDSDDDPVIATEDKIDELDDIVDDSSKDEELDDEDEPQPDNNQPRVSGYFYDHASGAVRRAFNRRSIEEEWGDDESVGFNVGLGAEDRSKAAFGSDDVPVDEEVRRRAGLVVSIEDALLLKVGRRVSPLREGWGDWFDKKSDFLRRDKMFKSNLEALNPLNNPLLQDPDGAGVTGLTRGDRLVQKSLLSEFKRVPFLVKKPLLETAHETQNRGVELKNEIKRTERRTLDEGTSNGYHRKEVVNGGKALNEIGIGTLKGQSKSEFSGHIYADGKRWGYYPGLLPHLSFSEFIDRFFDIGKCDMKVFMVWNSPPWMYSVRHQRGLESLLTHHPDACVVVFSETIELDFFKDNFLKDGYKVAVAMPNLDELLKDTPTHIFASAWFEWRKTKHYATHYSELVRLAAIYKYGGIYLDSDIIILKPLSLLINSVGLEDNLTGSSLNGAVMSFRKHSPFIMECLKEYFMTYDDTRLRWNGAELLTRVARKFLSTDNISARQLELKLQPSSIFFPISPQNITSLTSALIPEQGSLVARLMDHNCIKCSDVL